MSVDGAFIKRSVVNV